MFWNFSAYCSPLPLLLFASSWTFPVLIHLGAHNPLQPLFLSCAAPLHSIIYSVFSILMMMPAGRVYFMHNSRALCVGGSQAGTHLKASTAASAPTQHWFCVSYVSLRPASFCSINAVTLNFRMKINYLRINTFSLEFVDILLHL